MKFEYNKNLTYNDRVSLVAKEIRDEYPLISDHDAALAASFATPVDDKATNDEKFDRYYFIMKVIGKNNDEFSHVFNDAFDLYRDGLNSEIYKNAMFSIIEYATSDRDFPELLNYV